MLPLLPVEDEGVGRNMDQVDIDPEQVSDGGIYQVPRPAVIGGDMEVRHQCGRVAEQADKGTCEILASRDGPQGGSVTRYDNRLAPKHA